MPNATPMDKSRGTSGIIEDGMYTVELVEYGAERINETFGGTEAFLYFKVVAPAGVPVVDRVTGEQLVDEKTKKPLTSTDYIIRKRINPRALGTKSAQRPIVTALLSTEVTGGINDDDIVEVTAYRKMLEGRQCKAFIGLNERGYAEITNFKPLKAGPLGPVQDIRILSGLTKASPAAVAATLNPETKRPQREPALAVAGSRVQATIDDLAE